MIPAFGPSGILPPFIGPSPVDRAKVSPYEVTLTELVSRFGTSKERLQILRGLVAYRAALANAGIVQGFQWLDGSFIEDCETHRGRGPKDIDIVTFAYRPIAVSAPQDWATFVAANDDLFNPVKTKADLSCDAYYIDLNKAPHLTVLDTAYFNSLFSHQRDTAQWKGMLVVKLQSDDAVAAQMIAGTK
ncbi:hypothetical protein AXW83_18220 [Bosea sp. PAMC 26642]|nr:hypothetical protein AXW83_18220 [Bosea sp. PAMC 26642]